MASTRDERLEDADWLEARYIEEQRTRAEIAELCDCSKKTVSRWLQRHGIQTRAGRPQVYKRLKDADWLRERYVERELTLSEIAETCDCSNATVSRSLQKHGIETRHATDYSEPSANANTGGDG